MRRQAIFAGVLLIGGGLAAGFFWSPWRPKESAWPQLGRTRQVRSGDTGQPPQGQRSADTHDSSGERAALVIGNSRYDRILENPGNDADAIEAALTELGFSVLKRKDLSRQRMRDSLVDFRRRLSRGGLGLFYYAGHGIQMKGENYLVPIGALLREEFEAQDECMPISQVLGAMVEAEVNLKVVVLDCCRDNPFQRGWTRSRSAKGLTGMSNVPEGTLIAFSTAPNQTADDGTGGYSPYTRELVKTLRSRPVDGLELGELFREASRAVKRQTRQVPWLHQEASLERYYLWKGVPLRPSPLPGVTVEAPPLAVAPFDERQARSHQEAWARHLGKPVEETNSIGMKLVLIPAGEFLMGAPDLEEWHESRESPQHRVRITKPFYLGKYEVTQGEYERVLGTNPSSFSAAGDGKEIVSGQDTSRFPVERVSWDDAVEFCRKLSQQEGRTYRLPTEAEWEYGCRGGTTTPFSFGSVLNGREANCDGSYPYGTSDNGPYLSRTTTVGSYRPNGFGLHDGHGNVWEWVADWYDSSYYAVSPRDDPPGPSGGSDRGLRGGSWFYDARRCRSARRYGGTPGYRSHDLGFRVARVTAE